MTSSVHYENAEKSKRLIERKVWKEFKCVVIALNEVKKSNPGLKKYLEYRNGEGTLKDAIGKTIPNLESDLAYNRECYIIKHGTYKVNLG